MSRDHCFRYDGSSTTLKRSGELASCSQIIGGVGDIVSHGAYHLHLDVIVDNHQNGEVMNYNPMLRHLNIASKAFIPDQGEQELTWNPLVSEWSYDPMKIYYHRNVDGSEHFLAMTENKEEVKYDQLTNAWYLWDSSKETFYINSSGYKLKWLPTQEWTNVQ